MSKKAKRILIITASALLLILVAAILLGCLLMHHYDLTFEEIKFRAVLSVLFLIDDLFFPDPPSDTEEYITYRVYDSLLVCVDPEDASSRWSREYPEWSFYYHDVPGHSDDQFVWTRRTRAVLYPSTEEYHLLQNPDNLVDVWTDWTIQEIQIYTSRHSIESEERFETSNSDMQVITTITDPDCLAELLTFVTSDESRPVTRDSIDGLSAWKTTYIYVRVIFNESESIVWDTMLRGYQNSETGEQYFSMYKDTTEWDATKSGLGIDRDEFWVENLPNLEAFLLDAVETLREGTE